MIHYLARVDHHRTVLDYLKSWAGPSHPRMKMLSYETLPTILPRGSYVFSDLELLSSEQAALAGDVWSQLAAAGEGIRLLNHPLRAMRRYALLREMREAGSNQFAVYRRSDRLTSLRFPAFVRHANEHFGSLTNLLHDHQELDQAIVRMFLRGVSLDDVLIVEFCDTSRNGLFRKYSAFRVGDRIVPRHLMFSQKWVIKVPDLVDASKIEEEHEYLESNPHEQELRDIFDRAHIDYGRIDYGLLDDRIQVWEINTNPIVMVSRDQYGRQRLPAQEVFARKIRLAFESIDSPSPTQPMVPISLTECARRIRDGC